MRHFKSAQWRYRFETARNRLVQARSRYAKPHLSRNDAVGQASRLSQTSKNCALRRFLQPPGLAIVQWRQVDCEWRQARRLSYALTTAAARDGIVKNACEKCTTAYDACQSAWLKAIHKTRPPAPSSTLKFST